MDALHSLNSTNGATIVSSDLGSTSPSDSEGSFVLGPPRPSFSRFFSSSKTLNEGGAACPGDSVVDSVATADHAERNIRLTPRMLARLRPMAPSFSTPLRTRSSSCPVDFEPSTAVPSTPVEPTMEVVPGSLLRSRATLKRTTDEVTVGETNFVSRGRRSLLDSLTCRDTYACTIRAEYNTTQYYSDSNQPLPQRRSFQKMQTVLRLATTRKFEFCVILLVLFYLGIEGLTSALLHARPSGSSVVNVCPVSRHLQCEYLYYLFDSHDFSFVFLANVARLARGCGCDDIESADLLSCVPMCNSCRIWRLVADLSKV